MATLIHRQARQITQYLLTLVSVVSIRQCIWGTPFSMHGTAACLQQTLNSAAPSRQVEVEVFDHTLKLQQAPDSHDLGQTGNLLMTVVLTAQ
jgi:hypothetical protein